MAPITCRRHASTVDGIVCRVTSALGRQETCPEGACPFWEHPTPIAEAGCGLGRLDLELDRPDIAAYLLDVRCALLEARTVREAEEARLLHAALWPPELSGR